MKLINERSDHNKIPAQKKVGKKSRVNHATTIMFTSEDAAESDEHYGLRKPGEPSVADKAAALSVVAEQLTAENATTNLKTFSPLRRHPVASAVTFLTLKRELNPTGDPAFQAKLFELCDAWHWLHMEHYGEHAMAIAGTRTRTGSDKNASDASKRREIVKVAIESLRPTKLYREQIVERIMPVVQAQCAAAGLKPPGRATLLAWVGKLRPAAK